MIINGLSNEDSSFLFDNIDRKADIRIAIDMLIVFAGDRKGEWCIKSPVKPDIYDPLGTHGYVGFKCCEDGEVASIRAEEVFQSFKEIKANEN